MGKKKEQHVKLSKSLKQKNKITISPVISY